MVGGGGGRNGESGGEREAVKCKVHVSYSTV